MPVSDALPARDLAMLTLANARVDVDFEGVMNSLARVAPGTHFAGRAVVQSQEVLVDGTEVVCIPLRHAKMHAEHCRAGNQWAKAWIAKGLSAGESTPEFERI